MPCVKGDLLPDEIVEARKDTTVVLHPLTDDRRILPLERTGERPAGAAGFHARGVVQPGLPEPAQGMKPSTRQRFLAMSFDFPRPAGTGGVAGRRDRDRS